ncbi:NAD(P)-binding protein [Panus rudis PR-1116 ss-1]|nr:NAD(P)-binding protein [Panus rudis PR-1116 ss-1]
MSSAGYSPRVALVTGAAQGIGKAIALRLAQDGIDIAVNDIQSKEDEIVKLASEIEALGRKAVAVPADVSDETQVKAMVDRAVEFLGSLDIMVANAGIGGAKPLIELSGKEFDRVISVNVRGTMLCFKYAAIQMIKQGKGGRIIGASNISVYAATKFAVRGLTQTLEMAPHEITVNAYLPGMMMTPLPDPAVIGSLVSYLCKPEAYFITGNVLLILCTDNHLDTRARSINRSRRIVGGRNALS